MLILGMDSTAVTASVALAEVKDGALISHSVFTVKNKMTHSENLMPMVDHILQVYGAKVSDLELLAVNAGPGSFTGVRIGVATVKGLAFPNGLPCASVSTLDSLAEEAHINKYYLSHAFKQEYGISPINYMNYRRIEESKYLLAETDLSLTQISQLLGVSSLSYFSQVFRKTQASSPLEYRQSVKQI